MSKQKELQKQLFESQLGPTLYEFGVFNKVRIHEKGISYTKNNIIIIWNDIKDLYYRPVKWVHSINGIPINEGLETTFTVIDKANNHVKFTAKEYVESDIYSFFVKNIFDRQWNEFYNVLIDGGTSIFGSIAVNLNNIGEPYNFRSGSCQYRNIVELQRIIGYWIQKGNIYIAYLNDKGKQKKRSYGEMGYIPNFMVVHHFLNNVSKENVTKIVHNIIKKE